MFPSEFFIITATAVRLSTSERKTGDSIAKKLGGFLRRCYMDLQLVLDSSGSIGSTSFKKGKDANKVTHETKLCATLIMYNQISTKT